MKMNAATIGSFRLNRFYVHTVLVNFLFWLPMWILYLQQVRGMSLALIGVMQGVGFVISAISEVPAGAVADRYGRRISLLIGSASFGVLTICYGYATWIPLLFVIHVLWSVAQTFFTGADVAFLYDGLKEDGREEEYSKIMGHYTAIVQSSQAAAALLGGVIAGYSMNQPFLWSGLLCISGGLILFKFREPRAEQAEQGKAGILSGLESAVRFGISNGLLRDFIIFSTVISLPVFMLLFFFIQPFVADGGIPLEWIGLIILLLRAAGIIGSSLSHRLTKHLAEWTALFALPGILAGGLIAAAILPVGWAIAVLSAMALLSSALKPTFSTIMNRMIPSGSRATMLSLQSLLFTLLLAVAQTTLGTVAELAGFSTLFLIMAFVVALTAAMFLVIHGRSLIGGQHQESPAVIAKD